jgi:hypothetical protein
MSSSLNSAHETKTRASKDIWEVSSSMAQTLDRLELDAERTFSMGMKQ